jgi:hypothetical protein
MKDSNHLQDKSFIEINDFSALRGVSMIAVDPFLKTILVLRPECFIAFWVVIDANRHYVYL